MLDLESIHIRQIAAADNPHVAKLIRDTLAEFGANRPGTVYYDDATDHLFELFSTTPRSVYYVALAGEKIVGGGGIFPSNGLPESTCELVKMYLYPDARGIGLGRLIIEKCISFAQQSGFQFIYLETMPELRRALDTYARFGFQYIDKPMGNTGHFGCDLYMLKDITGTSQQQL